MGFSWSPDRVNVGYVTAVGGQEVTFAEGSVLVDWPHDSRDAGDRHVLRLLAGRAWRGGQQRFPRGRCLSSCRSSLGRLDPGRRGGQRGAQRRVLRAARGAVNGRGMLVLRPVRSGRGFCRRARGKVQQTRVQRLRRQGLGPGRAAGAGGAVSAGREGVPGGQLRERPAALLAGARRRPLMVEAWRRQVVMLIEMGECREAALWADKAMELFPNDPDLLAAKATALCRLGDPSAAFKIADQAIRPPSAEPLPRG